jgi:hypothetical protein
VAADAEANATIPTDRGSLGSSNARGRQMVNAETGEAVDAESASHESAVRRLLMKPWEHRGVKGAQADVGLWSRS